VLSNALLPKDGGVAAKHVMLVKPVHESKAYSPIDVTPLPSVTLERLVQFWNAT
jgi:hypothetical protein